MFWKTLGAIAISVSISAAVGGRAQVIPESDTLSLKQQKALLEWNMKQDKAAGNIPTDRIQAKLDELKKQNRRLFLDEKTAVPRHEIKLRLSQEIVNDTTVPL